MMKDNRRIDVSRITNVILEKIFGKADDMGVWVYLYPQRGPVKSVKCQVPWGVVIFFRNGGYMRRHFFIPSFHRVPSIILIVEIV